MAARTRGPGRAGEEIVRGAHPERPVRFALPADLGRAARHLDDENLDRLVKAAVAEARRRGRKVPGTSWTRRPPAAVTPGQERMILAAFDSGLEPAAIARAFRLSRDRVDTVIAGRRRPWPYRRHGRATSVAPNRSAAFVLTSNVSRRPGLRAVRGCAGQVFREQRHEKARHRRPSGGSNRTAAPGARMSGSRASVCSPPATGPPVQGAIRERASPWRSRLRPLPCSSRPARSGTP